MGLPSSSPANSSSSSLPPSRCLGPQLLIWLSQHKSQPALVFTISWKWNLLDKSKFENWPGIKYLQRFGFHWMTLVFGKYSNIFNIHPTCEDILGAEIKILGITTKLSLTVRRRWPVRTDYFFGPKPQRSVLSSCEKNDNLLHTLWHLMEDLV